MVLCRPVSALILEISVLSTGFSMPCFFSTLYFFVGDFIYLKLVPEGSAEMLCAAPKHKNPVRHLTDKIRTLEKFCSSTSYRA